MYRLTSCANQTTRGSKLWQLWLAALVVFCLAPLPGARAATFTASLDRDTLTLGESVMLSLSFEGGTPKNVPTPAEVPNLQITYSGTAQSMTTVNGQFSATVSYNFTVTPRQPGDYTIAALTAEVGAEKLTSAPLTLKVLKPSAPTPDAVNSGSQVAFLKLVLPRKELFVGETIAGQLQIYVQNRIGLSGLQLTGFPSEGFNVGKMIEGQRRQTQIGNAVYTIIPVSFTLKPVKAGALTLGPITANATVEVPSPNRRRDPFDPFGMFGSNEQRQMALATEPVEVQSQQLPRETAPPNFNGAVGTYTMTMTAGPTNVAAGDPITVKIQITGRGSLDSLTMPDQPAWHDFKSYPPTTKVETTDALGLQGTKTFEQIVTPQSADIKALPPVSFSFFDPEQKAYRTLNQPGVPLVVRPGGAMPLPTIVNAASRQDSPPPTQDIVPIKQRLGTLAQIGPPLIEQPWFLSLQGVPILAFMAVVVWRQRTEQLANNPRLRRQRQVAQVIRAGLEDLKRSAAANDSDQFFATVFRLLQEQLGERLDLPATAITESVIDEHLRPRNAPEALVTSVEELFQACNLARYAPVRSSQEFAAVISNLDGVLRQLQALKI